MRYLVLILSLLALDARAQKQPVKVLNIKSVQTFPRPTISAGDDQTITLPISEIILQLETKPDSAQIRGVHCSLLSGRDDAKIGSLKKNRIKITNLEEGKYQFLLDATILFQKETYQVYDTVGVTVISGKKWPPPKVDAGDDITITLPTNSVSLYGRVENSDPNGIIRTYLWTSVSGPSQPIIKSPASQETEVTNLVKGEYQFGLFVTDNNGSSAQDYVNITVLLPASKNKPPVANAGSPQNITSPANTITLSGTAYDPDGSSVIVRWTKTRGEGQPRIVSPNNEVTKITNLTEGIYEFTLSVTDTLGLEAKDKVIVKVLPPHYSTDVVLPIARAGEAIVITLPKDSVTLTGVGTFPGSTGFIKAYRWVETTGKTTFTIEHPDRAITKVRNLLADNYEFEFTIIDNHGNEAQDYLPVTVLAPRDSIKNNAPVVDTASGDSITSPTHNDTDPKTPNGPDSILPLLVGIGLGISVLAGGWYFFFWLPSTQKVMVYFMHKDEEILAHKLMPDSKRTEGYSISHCSRSNINKMKKKGLAIHVLNPELLVINTPGKTRTLNYTVKKGERKLTAEKIDKRPGVNIKNLVSEERVQRIVDDFPAFYIITLDTPLLPEFEAKIKGIGLRIIQHVPYNSYILFVEKPNQLTALKSASFDFIRLINRYSPSDTGLMVREDHFLEAVNAEGDLTLDIVLHREEDKGEVFTFLEQRKINILGSYRNRIRITVPARSLLNYNLASNKYIQAIYEYIPPVLHNDVARQIIGIEAEDHVNIFISETGLGEIIGVADTGIDKEHPDLKSNIISAVAWGRKETNDTSDPHGHGTHVTGSIVGDGTASGGKIKGMAPGAKVFFQSLMDDAGTLANFDLKLQELFKEAYQHGARIHNNSWGAAAEARYTIDATIVDEFIFEHPEMLIVISAGNEGICNPDNPNERGYVGFGSVGSPATTKNGLTVGASRNKRSTGGYASATYGKIWPDKFTDPPTSNELISGDPDSIAAFSSRGRCDDYRMKPDIVAPGTDILSTKSSLAPLNKFHGGYAQYGDAYAFLGGTSMSAPIVSGAAAIVREYYKNKMGFSTPSGALIKATLINGTRKLKGMSAIHDSDMIPNPNQGYGMLDLAMTIPNERNMFHLEFRDSLKDPAVTLNTTGQEYAVRFSTKKVTWIRACLAYTDFPVRSIQNNLDLLMDYEPTRQKWSGNIGINADDKFASRKEDSTNNMEIIRVETAQPGLYTIKVFGRNLPKGQQGFALVITTGDMDVVFE